MRVPAFYHDDFSRFDFGEDHPFKGERFARFLGRMKEFGLDAHVDVMEPKTASIEELKLVHTEGYIERVKELESRGGLLSVDTQVMPGMFDAARLFCGSSLSSVRHLLSSEGASTVISLGGFHHAGPESGEGFCVFNDVAVAAKGALEEFGLERVLVLDTDAHQGNGTEMIFYEEPRVLFISIHQDPRTLYPGTGFIHQMGEGEGTGYNINIPMPPFSTDHHYEQMYEQVIKPVCMDFDPQLVIRNGGSDPYFGDILTNLMLTSEGLTDLGRWGREISGATGGKLLDLCVSGYGEFVTQGWMAILKGTLDAEDVKVEYGMPAPPHQDVLHSEELKRYVDAVSVALREKFNRFYPSLKDRAPATAD